MRSEPEYLGIDDPSYLLDPAGRTTLLLQKGQSWFLIVLDGSRVDPQVVTLDATPQCVEMKLGQLPQLRVRVVDGQGLPVAGVLFGSVEAGPGAVRPLRLMVLRHDR